MSQDYSLISTLQLVSRLLTSNISLNHWGEVVGFRYANRVTAAPLDLPEKLVGPIHDGVTQARYPHERSGA